MRPLQLRDGRCGLRIGVSLTSKDNGVLEGRVQESDGLGVAFVAAEDERDDGVQ